MSSASALASLKIVMSSFEDGAKKAIDETAETVLEKSRTIYCPKKTGALRNSGKTEAKSSGTKYTQVISFGGSDAPYAPFVHEIPKNYTVGGWKYLTTPFNIEASNLENKIKEKVKL
jgi:hypothetical protein